jgi:hypothetical protein
MEAGPLRPPPLLERLVFLAIPPAEREAVAGDLREMYVSPVQYLRSAAGTLPFVIASQIRRNANPPVLVIQASIVILLLGGFSGHSHAATVARDAAAAFLLLLFSLLFGVYRGRAAPSAKWAILEALLVSAAVLGYARAILFDLRASHRLDPDQPAWLLFMWLILPFGMPAVGALRAAMVLARERRRDPFTPAMPVAGIAAAYDDFAARVRRRNRIDMALLLGLTALSGFALAFFPLHRTVLGWAILYPVAAVYLFLHGAAPARPEGMNFSSLRAFFRREIRRQCQLRSFLLWLLPAPPLFAFCFAGIPAPAWALLAGIGLAFLCFLLWAADREQGAHARALAQSLAQMRERRPA